MDFQPLIAALSVVAVAAYVVVLYWAVVAYLEDVRAGRARKRSRVEVLTSVGLLVLAVVALVAGGDPVRIALQLVALYRLVEGPPVRRTA